MRTSDLNILMSLGLNKTESTIYIDLIKNPNSSVQDIARRTKIHRPNVYDAIGRLKEKELIIEVINHGANLYKSFEPENLKFYAEKISEEVNKLISELKKISSKENNGELLSLYEGDVAVKSELFNLLDQRKPLFIALNNNSCSINDFGFLEAFNKKRINLKIKLNLICLNPEPVLKELSRVPYTEVKALKKGLNDSFVTTIVSGDFFYYYLQRGEKQTLIRIVNDEISEQQKKHFEFAWNMSEKL